MLAQLKVAKPTAVKVVAKPTEVKKSVDEPQDQCDAVWTDRLFVKYPEVFQPMQLNNDSPMTCHFQLKDQYKDRSLTCRGYALPEKEVEDMMSQIQDLKKKGFVKEYSREEHPHVLSPAMLVGKPDGSKRLVVDYSRLNDWVVPTGIHLPKMDLMLDHLASYRWKTRMDLASGFVCKSDLPLKPKD